MLSSGPGKGVKNGDYLMLAEDNGCIDIYQVSTGLIVHECQIDEKVQISDVIRT